MVALPRGLEVNTCSIQSSEPNTVHQTREKQGIDLHEDVGRLNQGAAPSLDQTIRLLRVRPCMSGKPIGWRWRGQCISGCLTLSLSA